MSYTILPRYTDGSPQWLEQRRQGVGASDVAAILGISPWATPYTAYLAKIGERWREPEGEHLEWGHRLEPAIAGWVAEHHPEIGTVVPGIDVQSIEYPWLMAKPDRIIESGTDVLPLELKTSIEYARDEWETVPPYYLVQVLTQCIVLGADTGYLAALVGGNKSRFFTIDVHAHCKKVDRILTETEVFWKRVQARDAPPVTNVAEATHKWPGDTDAAPHVDSNEDILDLAGQYVIAKSDEKSAREDAEEIKLQILQLLGDDTVAVDRKGRRLLTYKPQSGARRLDWKRFETNYPDVYADLVSTGEPTRVLRVDKGIF